jgi:hypothetical protein
MKQAMHTEENQQEFMAILRALKQIKYGSVEITIHASKVVQIETREKVRWASKNPTE